MNLRRNRNVLVIGLPGCGKSRFSAKLARRLKVPHVEVDRLFWGTGDLRTALRNHISTDGWVVEGHFTKISDLVLPRAGLVVYLDYSAPLVFFRFCKRAFMEPDKPGSSIPRWFWRFRRSRSAFAGVSRKNMVRLRSPSEARRFLRQFYRL